MKRFPRGATRCRWWRFCMIAFGYLAFVGLYSACVSGWMPSNPIKSSYKTTTRLNDAAENFPTALNMPSPSRNISQAFSRASSANFIPPERLRELQETVDIVSVIETYGLPRFARSGPMRATCLCPFHDDRNPSMSIDGTRGIYKCFSCGAGGNVFSFIREYSKLQSEDISFTEAVNLVEKHFAQGDTAMLLKSGINITVNDGFGVPKNVSSKHARPSKNTKSFETNRKRIAMANAATAAFYETCLGLRSAGLARQHLRTRGMQPQTIRAFAIGYAPDAYFNPQANWGEGSLVEHLQQKGFTSREILDAGLATIIKKDAPSIEIQQEKNKKFEIPYSSLVDRFRGRLMVPIFDDSGSQVLGFGGRTLDEERAAAANKFLGPKYLNSPETPIFQKKNILFGQHMADKALRFWDKEEHIARAVVIVEGYMDAITLWQAGVREAVACMGTGITEEQLTAAAVLAGNKNGRVIFCLDNDNAGIAAVERLCKAGLLGNIAESRVVEFRVAQLPAGVKDPAEYIELHGQASEVDKQFRRDILEGNSLPWIDWYEDHILSQFNLSASVGDKGSLSNIMDNLAILLSMIKETTERKKRFDQVAEVLIMKMCQATNVEDVSETARLQIQSELAKKVSIMTKAASTKSGGSLPKTQRSNVELEKTLMRMAPSGGERPGSSLSKIPNQSSSSNRGKKQSGERNAATPKGAAFQSVSSKKGPQAGRKFRAKGAPRRKPSLTPHFSGFKFQSNDVAWLEDDELTGKGTSKSKSNRKDDDDDPVYFNSNEYHGDQFLTDEAESAGYLNSFILKDPDILVKGLGSLVGTSNEEFHLSAENELLRTLVHFSSARSSLQRIINIGNEAGSQDIISWTSPAKCWLFDRLMRDNATLQDFGRTNLASFQSLLSAEEKPCPEALTSPNRLLEDSCGNLTSVPTDQESTSQRGEMRDRDASLEGVGSAISTKLLSESALGDEQKGALDFLFEKATAVEDFLSLELSEDEVALRVQECYCTLVWSASVQRLRQKQQKWFLLKAEQDKASESSPENELDVSSDLELIKRECEVLGAEIKTSSEQVRLLAGALRSQSSSLVQRAMTQSLAATWQDDYSNLSSRLSKHIAELDQWVPADSEDEEIKESESYETVLEQAQEDWGKLYEDDYFWSEEDVVASQPTTSSVGTEIIAVEASSDGTSIEEFSARLEEDWGWLAEPRTEVAQSEKPGLYEFDEDSWDDFIRRASNNAPGGGEGIDEDEDESAMASLLE